LKIEKTRGYKKFIHTRAFLDNREGLSESAKKYALYSWRDFQNARQFIHNYRETTIRKPKVTEKRINSYRSPSLSFHGE